jgi:hypothetical protein
MAETSLRQMRGGAPVYRERAVSSALDGSRVLADNEVQPAWFRMKGE